MAQVAKPIDITNTYVPVDPQFFPQNYLGTARQDAPYPSAPILAYEGYNFLPTSYGYKSYFGINAIYDIDQFPSFSEDDNDIRIDKVFVVGTLQYQNFFVALTNRGIYTNTGQTGAAWIQQITITPATAPTRREWSMAVIGNNIYMYQAGGPSFYSMVASTPIAIETKTPNFLNMAGQLGIFRAGGRLGFWDSEQSVAWSSIDDATDFTPDVITLAGSSIFNDVIGPIVTIQSSGDGFIIYSTNSIVLISRDLSATFQWNPTPIMTNNGPAYSNQVAVGMPDTEHYAYTSLGLYKISGTTAQPLITDTTDLLKESLYPVGIRLIENRYIVFDIIESKFIEGLVEFESVTYDGGQYTWPTDSSINNPPDYLNNCDVAGMFENGYFTEQQALFEQARQFQGMPAIKPGTLAKPTWTATYVFRVPVVYDTNSDGHTRMLNHYNGETPSPLESMRFTGVTYGSNLNSAEIFEARWPCVSLDSLSQFLNVSNPIKQFCETQRAYWDVNDAESIANFDMFNGSIGAICDAVNSAPAEEQNYVEGDGIYPESFYFEANWGSINKGEGWYNGIPAQYYSGPWAQLVSKGSTFTISACSCKAVQRLGALKYFLIHEYRTIEADQIPRTGGNPSIPGTTTGAFLKYHLDIETFDADPDTDILVESRCQITGWEYMDVDGVVRTISGVVCIQDEDVPFIPPGEDCVPNALPNPSTQPWVTDPLDLPDFTITLQDGTPGPYYPVYAGAWIYDMEYKKWGKAKCEYRQMLDLSPINTNQGNIVNTKRFGINAGIFTPAGLIHRFDNKPDDSYIKYGKVGYYRLGYTDAEEVKVNFRIPCTGSIKVQGSLDGRNPEMGLFTIEEYTDATSVIVYPSISARWFSIKVQGNFDITHMEFRGVTAGRR